MVIISKDEVYMSNHYRSQKGAFHHSFIFKDENEDKRHKSRCVYYEGSNKYCSYYCMNCKGSNTCEKYEEKPNAKKNIIEDKKTTKISITSTLEESTNILGKKIEEKRRQTLNDIRREIINFSINNK